MLKRIRSNPTAMFAVGLAIGAVAGAVGFAMTVAGSGITVLP